MLQEFLSLGSIVLLLVCLLVVFWRVIRSEKIFTGHWVWGIFKLFVSTAGAVVVIFLCLLIVWTTFGIHRHMLPMEQGGYGKYGIIDRPEIFPPGTHISSFSARYVPSRILRSRILRFWKFLWPVPETIQVSVTYRRPSSTKSEEWSQTFLVACREGSDDDCVPLYELMGILLVGKNIDTGKDRQYQWVYLRGQIVPNPTKHPALPRTVPTPLPPPPPPKPRSYFHHILPENYLLVRSLALAPMP